MLTLRSLLVTLLSLGIASVTFAQGSADNGGEGAKCRRGGKGAHFGQIRKKILEKFDKDGDGKLSDDERKAAREAFKERHGKGRPDKNMLMRTE